MEEKQIKETALPGKERVNLYKLSSLAGLDFPPFDTVGVGGRFNQARSLNASLDRALIYKQVKDSDNFCKLHC
jgi:hypothetical protein